MLRKFAQNPALPYLTLCMVPSFPRQPIGQVCQGIFLCGTCDCFLSRLFDLKPFALFQVLSFGGLLDSGPDLDCWGGPDFARSALFLVGVLLVVFCLPDLCFENLFLLLGFWYSSSFLSFPMSFFISNSDSFSFKVSFSLVENC